MKWDWCLSPKPPESCYPGLAQLRFRDLAQRRVFENGFLMCLCPSLVIHLHESVDDIPIPICSPWAILKAMRSIDLYPNWYIKPGTFVNYACTIGFHINLYQNCFKPIVKLVNQYLNIVLNQLSVSTPTYGKLHDWPLDNQAASTTRCLQELQGP